jgi:pimeloyl-ACP methyl ester carboxylesterase
MNARAFLPGGILSAVKQDIRFCKSFDGARIAYAITGEGPPLVKAPHWLTHLEYEAGSPIWRPWIEELSRTHTLVRMDVRGCGLSERDVEFSFDHYVNDLEAVIDAAGLDRFSLLGHSQGGAVAVDYAARHPSRVGHLAVLGGYARGSLKRGLPPERLAELEALLKLVEVAWGGENPAYRNLFSTLFAPGATAEQINSFSELQRRSTSPQNAVRILRSFTVIDVTQSAHRVTCPALLLHARGDTRVPFSEGLELASLVPGAKFVPLDSDNHVLVAHDPAFSRFFAELRAFLPGRTPASLIGLTGREGEIIELIARGLDNTQIAVRLGMSEKTVRNHITHIFDKLGVETRAQAIVRAREAGLGRESRLS